MCIGLLVGGAEALEPWIDEVATARADEDVDVGELVDVLREHRLGLSTASVACLFLLLMNGMMAIGLRWIVRARLGGDYARVGSVAEHAALQ